MPSAWRWSSSPTLCGAAVALEPATGRVLAIASSPTYDQNLVEDDFARVLAQRGPCEPAAPLLNRASAGLFIPGSTFKVVTAAAAIDSGAFTAASEFDDRGFCTVYGKRVFNFADQEGPEIFGRVTLAEALEHSINAVFCDIGKELGPQLVLEYAERFGFYEKPPLETPEDEREASGLYRRGELFLPSDPNAVDPGRLAFGQERLLATPFQMAMVAAGVANGGSVMRPFVVDRILKPDGSILTKTGDRGVQPGSQPRHGGRPDRHDGARRGVGDGHRGPDPGHPGRRQDRDGRDRAGGPERRLVHRLRARRQPAGSGRRRAVRSGRDRRRRRCPDRASDHGGRAP